MLLYEMKFLVPNYSCLQSPWPGDYRSPDPGSLSSQSSTEFVEFPPPPTKFPGMPLPRLTGYWDHSSFCVVTGHSFSWDEARGVSNWPLESRLTIHGNVPLYFGKEIWRYIWICSVLESRQAFMCIYARHIGMSSVIIVDLIQDNISWMQVHILTARYFAVEGSYVLHWINMK
jgi:hypothetical protein